MAAADDPHRSIVIRGARVHNLKNVDLSVPRGRLVVITGLSGSGKSSLAFDTIYAEGQRRYVESLSSYARQFLGVMDKPDVDSIAGLSPAISIEQKTVSHNPRSTVGTVTELYDYLRLLYARVGIPHCPKHGKPLRGRRPAQIADDLLASWRDRRLMLLAPVVEDRKGEHLDVLAGLAKRGFVRLRIDGEVCDIESAPKLALRSRHSIEIVVDRLRPRPAERQRLLESIETALEEGGQRLRAVDIDSGKEQVFSAKQACPVCSYSPPQLEPKLFSFNATAGACETCLGLGEESVFSAATLITDPGLSLAGGAIPGWSRDHRFYFRKLKWLADKLGFSTATPYRDLPAAARKAILEGWSSPRGGKKFEGVLNWIKRRYLEAESQMMREWYGRFMTAQTCSACGGARLRGSARAVTVGGLSLPQLAELPLAEAHVFVQELKLDAAAAAIAARIVREAVERLGFLVEVGLGYLTLGRSATTLSGGENQRIRLASQVGSGLTGVTYVLDEPSIGLHPADNLRLLRSLERLRDQGNTVIVVEHDEEAMLRADHIIDVGPGAGRHGGEIVAAGPAAEVKRCGRSVTGRYLAGKLKIDVPAKRLKPKRGERLRIEGARGNNLRSLSVDIPLGVFTCVTGVSGSGKSTLVTDTLYRQLMRHFHDSGAEALPHRALKGLERIDKVIDIDQSPIGRTPRSNPATYTGLFTPLRSLFTELPLARERGYPPGHFSFNVPGGRCDACEGDGVKRVEMHFLPDVFVTCEVCGGKRYKEQTLEVKYRGKSIHDVLEMTVDEALEFFRNHPLPSRKLETLAAVGLGYIRLGQSAPTLSGGEAQRVKLANELSKVATGHTLYLLDEPTTGLHFHDIAILLEVLRRLRDAGNTIVVIEHNLDVIKTADWIIDLGPDGGSGGGRLIAAGSPEDVAKDPASKTGQHLKPLLK
ncbi:MAG: excinuclease ABC subunit UvrA, partial [Betaproteobacteria bacterium AqS2]|nr:excinuclease ABC subunit UvrA [Betaproteobacteria bacterium AqS2]